jgi:hypothetical protein
MVIKVATDAPSHSFARPEICDWNTAPSPGAIGSAVVAPLRFYAPHCAVAFHPFVGRRFRRPTDTGVKSRDMRFATGDNAS